MEKQADELGQRVTKLISHGPYGQFFDRKALEAFAMANGVWKESDAKLSNGLARMSVVNRIRGMLKQGKEIKWLT